MHFSVVVDRVLNLLTSVFVTIGAKLLSFACFKFHHIGGQTFSPFHLWG